MLGIYSFFSKDKETNIFCFSILLSFIIHLFATISVFHMNLSDNDFKDSFLQLNVKIGSLKDVKKRENHSKEASSEEQKSFSNKKNNLVADLSTQNIKATSIDKKNDLNDKEVVVKTKIKKVKTKEHRDINRYFSKFKKHYHKDKNRLEYKDSGFELGNSLQEFYKGTLTYEQILPLWLNKFRKYPEKARSLGIDGNGVIYLKINRGGVVISVKVIKSTGYKVLDYALVDMVHKAEPVIPVPSYYHPKKKILAFQISFPSQIPLN